MFVCVCVRVCVSLCVCVVHRPVGKYLPDLEYPLVRTLLPEDVSEAALGVTLEDTCRRKCKRRYKRKKKRWRLQPHARALTM